MSRLTRLLTASMMSFVECVGPVAVDELGQSESVLYRKSREGNQLP
jgi:hypothetical protein